MLKIKRLHLSPRFKACCSTPTPVVIELVELLLAAIETLACQTFSSRQRPSEARCYWTSNPWMAFGTNQNRETWVRKYLSQGCVRRLATALPFGVTFQMVCCLFLEGGRDNCALHPTTLSQQSSEVMLLIENCTGYWAGFGILRRRILPVGRGATGANLFVIDINQ